MPTRDRADHAEACDHQYPARRFGNGARDPVPVPYDLVENRRRLARARHAEIEQIAVLAEVGEFMPATTQLVRIAEHISVGESDEDTCSIEGAIEAERRDARIRLFEIKQSGTTLGDELPRRRYAVRADDKMRQRLGRIPDIHLSRGRSTARIGREGFGQCARRNSKCQRTEE